MSISTNKCILIKWYNLLNLNEIFKNHRKKIERIWRRLKLDLFPSHILPCKQNVCIIVRDYTMATVVSSRISARPSYIVQRFMGPVSAGWKCLYVVKYKPWYEIKHFIPQITTDLLSGSRATSKLILVDLNWHVKSVGWGIPLQRRLSAQCWANNINMWPNDVVTFNRPLCVEIVCLGFPIFFLLNLTIKKMISWSAGYTTSYQTKCQNWYVIQRSPLKKGKAHLDKL